ncbi:MAG: PQQ-binding-like beta-propeller repeat protein [Oscillospiraceae bacterium]|nr:PQQ-binding-like beta-propeller repeat protein [Oscillospiraceae bacterium]
MTDHMGRRMIGLLLCAVLLVGLLPGGVFAEEGGAFILVVEAGGSLVIAPEYVSYTPGQTVGEALEASGHDFTGLDEGVVTAIDGVVGNFTRSDQDGSYDLDKAASEVDYYRFSEAADSQPSEGLQQLMTAMAAYTLKDADVGNAAKSAYDTACEQFVGIDSDSAKILASRLDAAVSEYESAQAGTKHTVTFTEGAGAAITAENAYGKIWSDDGDGVLELPAGDYGFCMERDGLRVEGSITVSGATTVTAGLPEGQWLDLESFRLSGTYGEEDNENSRFTDGEFALGQWSGRKVTVPVLDTFTGAVYTYAEYDPELFTEPPALTAIYTMRSTGEEMEKALAFESWTSGAYSVLDKGAEGNVVTYRVSSLGSDGYTYSQDYEAEFLRIPTLTGIKVVDQEGTDQAATTAFDADVTEYTYKVLDSVISVTVSPEVAHEGYTVTVDGKDAAQGVEVGISGQTQIQVVVAANGFSNTYTLTIQPGEGKTLSFISSNAVNIEVVNSNGVVMPYTTHKETSRQNRYKYTLVPGEDYRYIATYDTYYHITDQFSLEEVANSTITVDFEQMDDWLSELAFGRKKAADHKGKLEMDAPFDPADHSYGVTYEDTEHLAYVWVASEESDVSILAIYDQVFTSDLYHGKQLTKDLDPGAASGTQLNRFLMDENPIENTVTIRLTKVVSGVTWYQDYVVDFHRDLTLEDMSAKCDGTSVPLVRDDGTTGFGADVVEYSVTVSMAAELLELTFGRYTDNTCYGESEVGYRVLVDGQDVTGTDTASIVLDGTLDTKTVTVTVENDKAPEGSTDYILHILRSPPVEAVFTFDPEDALLTLYETMSGERIWPDEDGAYQLCEGYSYAYTLTKYGHVGKSCTLDVGRDEDEALVVADGEERHTVTQSEAGGGAVRISWQLPQAQTNERIDPSLESRWPSFRGDADNNAITDAAIPIAADGGTLYWANQIGSGIDADAVGSPILVDGDLITYAGNTIYRVDTVSGQIKATGEMDHKSSFAITAPAYHEGMIFVALSNGTVQAFNAVTLESLWVYVDALGGQPNCPLTVHNGYLYTGFWNSETAEANFVCLSITDEDLEQTKETKVATWRYTRSGGFYWAGAYVCDDFVLVGSDDGANGYTRQTSRLLLLDPLTGALLDSWDGLNGDIRSTVVYDATTDAYYFTSKGGTFYSVQVSEDRLLTGHWSVDLVNGTDGVPMSTCSPVVYNGRAYVGVSGAGQFSAYSGHNITVVELGKKAIAYSVQTQGYPQTSGLLTTAYEAESGYVYVYFLDNMTPGKLRVLRDKAGQTRADYVTTESGYTVAYPLFTPTGDQAQYAICSPIVDEYGTVYFKNDSAYLMAYGSAIEKIQITTAPDKTDYKVGETFDPAGMVVTATYANGKTRDITRYVTYSTDPLTSGDTSFMIRFDHVMYHDQEDGTGMISGVRTTTPVAALTLTISEGEDVLLGDVNGNGKIDIVDANMISGHYNGTVGLTQTQLASADVNGDGRVDIVDANLVAAYYNGAITAFPAG